MKLIRAVRIDDDATAMAYFLITLLVVAAMLAMLPETGAIKLG
jgi:hypothetical protein